MALGSANAQKAGFPGSTFNTNDNGKLLAHIQSNNNSDLGNFSKQWIGIGQPISRAYGLRIQWKNYAGIFALTGSGNKKTLELNWGGSNNDTNFEINNISSFTDPSKKVNRFTIKPGGNIGIGTKAPAVKLDVLVNGRDGIRLKGNNTGDAFFQIANGGGTHYIFDDDDNQHALDIESANDLVFNANGPSEKMRIKKDGKVGIGTTAPARKLEVQVNGWDGIRLEGDNKGDVFFQIANGGGTHYIFDDDDNQHTLDIESANDLVFNAGGDSEKMRIKSGGNVGIHTTRPQYKLDVNGTARVNTIYTNSDKPRCSKSIP